MRSDSKPKRGRPKGAKTKELVHVVEIPPGCPRCNSTEHKVIQTPKQRPISGQINGKPYNHVTWRRCECKRCKSRYVLREYRLI